MKKDFDLIQQLSTLHSTVKMILLYKLTLHRISLLMTQSLTEHLLLTTEHDYTILTGARYTSSEVALIIKFQIGVESCPCQGLVTLKEHHIDYNFYFSLDIYKYHYIGSVKNNKRSNFVFIVKYNIQHKTIFVNNSFITTSFH